MLVKSISESTPAGENYQSVGPSRAKGFVLKLLKQLSRHSLKIHDGGEVSRFGALHSEAQEGIQESKQESIEAEVYIRSQEAYSCVLRNGVVGAAEAYILGYWDTNDLVAVVRFFVANTNVMDDINSKKSFVASISNYLLNAINKNTLRGSKRNIVAHYDLSNDFFKTFLDSKMMYSSAIFDQTYTDLESASENKLRHVCERLQLKKDDHLLEIGCGWGGLAIYAAKHYGCKVTAVTISDEQYRYAEQQIREEGVDNNVQLLNRDYRNIEGRYDKLVSIEMIEAVGHKFHETYFKKCAELLKPDGLFLIQAITVADQRYDSYKDSMDFIRRYIFPGGCLPSLTQIAQKFTATTDMQIVGVEDITHSYALTLAEWRKRFHNFYQKIQTMGFDNNFMRMWDYYLAYCEGAFRERAISTVQVLAAKPDCRQLPAVV